MGCFNWIWRTLQTLSVIAFGVVWLPTQTRALEGVAGTYDPEPMGVCTVSRGDTGTFGNAIASVVVNNFGSVTNQYAGGFIFFGQYVDKSNDALEAAEVALCLGVNQADIQDFSTTPVSASRTHADQTHMGFSFTLTEAAGGLDAGYHPYFIGTPPANAPTALDATAGDGQVSVAFTAPTFGGDTITNYQYSTDGGTNYTAFSPAATASPVTITGLTNGTAYSIKLRAVNSAGNGTESAAVSVLLGSAASEFAAKEDAKAKLENKKEATTVAKNNLPVDP